MQQLHLVFCLLMLQLMLGAVGVNNVGVFQSAHQAGFYIVDVDAAQLVPLHNLFLGQTFGFGLGRQFVDSLDDFVHIHWNTSHIPVDDHPYPVLFRLTADGIDFNFSQAPHGNLHALLHCLVWLFAG